MRICCTARWVASHLAYIRGESVSSASGCLAFRLRAQERAAEGCGGGEFETFRLEPIGACLDLGEVPVSS